ncbi:ankyrin repeat, SAM and basic leucine zipper domain-containing protein 1 [Mugil cephalus]|uniref:ankyrin repeat, SAM and basic leucine zipper domain-containing protein 1 n=1 Tax=Mugil cephalus TaxID=48193 RepID=UPI001FB7E01D|nr:ankyrin repeat, SAM and basic leucine zipper domain-containing protein 1 [Mugil cephalus]
MDGVLSNAFPAGEESDSSNDEWDIGTFSDKKSHCNKDSDAVVPHAEDNVSLLKRAINEGDTGTVERLLDSGMDVETRLGFEWTLLMCAVSVANYDVAKLLLDRGASASFSKDQCTVLMASCMASASEDKIARCVELLLSRNADPNMVDRSQMTCLMLAARDGHSKVINILVSHGAEINFQTPSGYTALSVAVQYGREEAVLKLLQLGADKTIRTKGGKSPADLAEIFNHPQIARLLTSPTNVPPMGATAKIDTLTKFSEPLPSKESVTGLDDFKLLLEGLDLGYVADILTENDSTWSYLLTLEKEDLEKIGLTDPEDQQKLLSAVQQMNPDKVDLDAFSQLEVSDTGSEELTNFLISVSQQFCYLTEAIQDVIRHFPSHPSQLVFSLDPKKEGQAVCNQLMVQTKDLQKEVICLRNLLFQMDEAKDNCQPPQPASSRNRRMGYLTTVALGTLGAGVLILLYKTTSGKVYML